MDPLTGKYTRHVDNKSRLMIPMDLREHLGAEKGDPIYIHYAPKIHLAIVLPSETYQRVQEVYNKLPMSHPSRIHFNTTVYKKRLDKDGRLQVGNFRKCRVVVVGNGDSFYITSSSLQKLLESNTDVPTNDDPCTFFSLEDTLSKLLSDPKV